MRKILLAASALILAGCATPTVPAWLNGDDTVVTSLDASAMQRSKHAVVRSGIATSSLPYPELTWMSVVKAIPPQSKACLTVYLKLHMDFRPGDGGKLPGLANTGLHRQFTSIPENVNGRNYPNTGWGGRAPDGLHWSARTGYGRWTDSDVAIHTYFYALSPKNIWGHVDPIGVPLPKGTWTAYVECLKLNTPGQADGGLYYESLDNGPTYVRNDIRWRDIDAPESLIREVWIDFYCGGTSCGKGPRGTVSFAGAVVTKGRPNMTSVAAEVERLNAR
jgi:hypothetical protein